MAKNSWTPSYGLVESHLLLNTGQPSDSLLTNGIRQK